MLSYSSSLCFLWWYVFALGSLNHHISVPLRIRLYLPSVCFIFCLSSQSICPSILSVCLCIWSIHPFYIQSACLSIQSTYLYIHPSSHPVYQFYLSIHSVYLYIHPFYLPIHSISSLSIHPFCLSTQSILSICPFYLCIQSIYLSILSPVCLSSSLYIYPSIHSSSLPVYPSSLCIHPSIHPICFSIYHVYNLSCIYMYVCAQSCLTHCDHVNYSLPGSSVHGISQARILEWVAMPSSRGSSRCRDQACVSRVYCIKSEFLPHWAIQAIYLPFLSSMYLWSFICPSCLPSSIYISKSIVYHLSSLPSSVYPWSVYLLSTYHLFIYFLCIICVCLSTFQCVYLSIHIYLLSKIDFFIIYHLFLSMYLLCICLSMKLKFETVSRSVVSDSLWPHGM